MKLTFKGGTSVSALPPTFARLQKACTDLPNGELVDGTEICAVVKIAQSTLSRMQSHAAMQDFSILYRQKRWFGNKATIQEAKKQFTK